MKAWKTLRPSMVLATWILTLSSCTCPTGLRQGWVAQATGPVPGRCAAISMALDGNGHVAASGSVWGGMQQDNGFTALHDLKSGELLWSQTQGGGGYDNAVRTAFDPQGNVAVGGTSARHSAFACWAAKYEKATGRVLWSTTLPEKGWGQGWGMCVASNGDVVVTGQAGIGAAADVLTARLDGKTGAVLWSAAFEGPGHLTDIGNAVVTGRGGDVLVCGHTVRNHAHSEALLLCYDARTGAQKWVASFNEAARGRGGALDLTVDGHGDVFVTGLAERASGGVDALLWKVNGSDGSTVWTKLHGGRGYDRGVAVAVKGSMVAIGGHLNEGPNSNGLLALFDSETGDVRWERQFVAAKPGEDQVRDVAFDPCGNVIASGKLGNKGGAMAGFVAICDGRNGDLLSQREHDGGSGSSNFFERLAVSRREVVVGGSALVGGASVRPSRFLIVKYDRVKP